MLATILNDSGKMDFANLNRREYGATELVNFIELIDLTSKG